MVSPTCEWDSWTKWGKQPCRNGFLVLGVFPLSISEPWNSQPTNKHGLIWLRIFHNIPYIMTLAQGYTILIYIVLWCFIPLLGTGTLSESLKTSWRASFSVLGRRQGVNLKLRVASKMLRSALKCLARTKPLLCGFMGHPGYWPATKLVWDMWVQNSMTGGDVFS